MAKAEPVEDVRAENASSRYSLSKKFCQALNVVYEFTRDYITSPPTNIDDCLRAFFGASELKG